jgi:cell division protein FtsN
LTITPDTMRDTAAPGSARFAIQTAAMRTRSAAAPLARRLRELGFDARVAQVSGSSLYRVRVGRFATESEATALLRRIRASDVDGIIVSDAHRESTGR